MLDIGTLGSVDGGPGDSIGYGINNEGEVTGESNAHAFLYSNGHMVDLNLEIGAAAVSYTLISGAAINDSGQIVANGYVDATGRDVAFLLTPVPLPTTAWLMLSGLSGLVGFSLCRRASSATVVYDPLEPTGEPRWYEARNMHGRVLESRPLPSGTCLKRVFVVATLEHIDAGWQLVRRAGLAEVHVVRWGLPILTANLFS